MGRSLRRTKAAAEPILHRAARIEDALHDFREKRARKRGLTATVIPYTGYGGKGWARVLCRVLLTKPGPPESSEQARYRNIRGWRSFTSVPVDDIPVLVSAGGREFTVTADRGGVVDVRIEVDLPQGWNTIQLSTEDSPVVEASIYVVDPTARFGVVSDVDDTVMVTALPRPFLAAWNTFVLDEHARRPVPGMSVLYERLTRAHPGSPVLYLSTGAWNVAPTLSRFLSRNLYPAGPLLLTDWGPTHDRWFRSGREHKRDTLRRLSAEFPDIRWLLIGDDGQHDEELYSEFLSDHPGNVAAVCIRQLSNSEAVFAGGRSMADAHNANGMAWMYAPDGAGLSEHLTNAGILPKELLP
ncbi:App1 family protein [Glaciihabitans sp. dw_435]|uniref:App1 family protein n=1 Tax=Glaciihabitans sp. dw_435 TaxID=2720081 RepID=UPI001BD3981B|nr:phosphatase domain-containing protein [Glaciihabitans sp. dw_435]